MKTEPIAEAVADKFFEAQKMLGRGRIDRKGMATISVEELGHVVQVGINLYRDMLDQDKLRSDGPTANASEAVERAYDSALADTSKASR